METLTQLKCPVPKNVIRHRPKKKSYEADITVLDATQGTFCSSFHSKGIRDKGGKERGREEGRVIEVKDHPFLLSPKSPAHGHERGGHKKRKEGREGREEPGSDLESWDASRAVIDDGARQVQDLNLDFEQWYMYIQ